MTAEEILGIHTDIFNRALKEQNYAALEGLYAGDYKSLDLMLTATELAHLDSLTAALEGRD